MNEIFIPADADALRQRAEALGYIADAVDETMSTNTDLIKLLREGTKCEHLLSSRVQSGGKGRLGRSFSSAYGGIYFSFTVTVKKEYAYRLTPLAGVASAKALSKLYGLDVKLKWVNDVWLVDKKLGGILAETVTDSNFDTIRAVIGIGINGANVGFPDTATSLSLAGIRNINANDVIAGTLSEFAVRLPDIGGACVMEEYRALSSVIGRRVRVHTFDGGDDYDAYAVAIADTGELIVDKNGEIRALSSGEVSVRL